MKISDVPTVDVLRAIDAGEPHWLKAESLASFPEKLLMAKADKLDRAGLINYGVSLAYPFLTDAGRARLAEACARPMCSDCVAFWAKHTRVNADGETEVDTIGRYCPCSPPKGPALAVVGTTSGAKQWTPEQLGEWLRSMGCPESEVPSVTEWFNRHSPVVPIEVQAKDPA